MNSSKTYLLHFISNLRRRKPPPLFYLALWRYIRNNTIKSTLRDLFMKKFRKRRQDEGFFEFMDDFLLSHIFLSLFVQVCFSGICFGIALLIEGKIVKGSASFMILITSGLCLVALIIMKVMKLLLNRIRKDVDFGIVTNDALFFHIMLLNICMILCVATAIFN